MTNIPRDLTPKDKEVLNTILKTVLTGSLGIVSCIEKKTGNSVVVLCARQQSPDNEDEYNIIPLAKLFDGNPYDQIEDPYPHLTSNPDESSVAE